LNLIEDFYLLFSSVSYPISKTKPIPIKTFCEKLPIPTSHKTRLVFYTFSPIKDGDVYLPVLHIPTVKAIPIQQYYDVAAAYEWSKDIIGLFFYVKNQLIDYQHILQTAQCSTIIMQQHLKSKLLEFLCSIRAKLIVFRAVEELKNILDQIDNNTSGQSTLTNSISMNFNGTTASSGRTQSTSGQVPSIGFSHLVNNPTLNENTSSPGN
jgi:hypothetical protein